MEWAAFEKVWGALTVQERVDVAGANAASAALAAAGGKVTYADLLPAWDQEPADEAKPRQSSEQLVAFMKGLVRRSKKRGNRTRYSRQGN